MVVGAALIKQTPDDSRCVTTTLHVTVIINAWMQMELPRKLINSALPNTFCMKTLQLRMKMRMHYLRH